MCILIPFCCNEQQGVSAPDIDNSVQNALLAVAGNRHLALFPDAAIATVERWSLSDDRLIKHQDDGALSAKKPAF